MLTGFVMIVGVFGCVADAFEVALALAVVDGFVRLLLAGAFGLDRFCFRGFFLEGSVGLLFIVSHSICAMHIYPLVLVDFSKS